MDEFDIKPESSEVKPIKLEGFSRYDIYPDGRVYDHVAKRNVIFNRHMNFAMFPDSGDWVMENIRDLINFLIKNKAPGFITPLPEYQPPSFSVIPKDVVQDPKLSKELYFLRKALTESTEAMMSKIEKGADIKEEQKRYIQAKGNLEDFKCKNPQYSKLDKYHPAMEYEVEDVNRRIDEIMEIIDEKKQEIVELRKELVGTGLNMDKRYYLTSAIKKLRENENLGI